MAAKSRCPPPLIKPTGAADEAAAGAPSCGAGAAASIEITALPVMVAVPAGMAAFRLPT